MMIENTILVAINKLILLTSALLITGLEPILNSTKPLYFYITNLLSRIEAINHPRILLSFVVLKFILNKYSILTVAQEFYFCSF